MAKKRVLSAVAPSGNVTIGNYIGAIAQWVKAQNNPDSENWFFVVDLHAMTTPYQAKTLSEKTREIIKLYLACGIDPTKSTLFIQSHVSAHAELAWILNCNTPMGWMRQMIQYKEKSAKVGDENVTVGLFDYPVLMAADILLYQTDQVPVGEDQRQHVEITREIARRFNRTFSNVFKEPEAINPPSGARIMGLDDPSVKMSKSASSKYHYIWLLDSPDDIRIKISRAVTDSQEGIVFDQNRPGLFNLLTIYQSITGETNNQIETKFSSQGYAEFKEDLAEKIIEFLLPIQNRYKEIDKDNEYINQVIADGAARATAVAQQTLNKVKKAAGLILPVSVHELKTKPEVSFEEWLKLDLEIGTIINVEEIPDADKLYKLTIDFGAGQTTLVAGIKPYYSADELIGQQVPILKNLAAKEIKGIKSKGMLLAVNHQGEAVLLNPKKGVDNGDQVS